MVADKFHGLAHVHRALDQVRTGMEPVRGKRGELFPVSLSAADSGGAADTRTLPPAHGATATLSSAVEQARALKEAFRAWYRCPTQAAAEAGLGAWESRVREHGPEPFRRPLPMLRTWQGEILNYFDHPYTNGFVEDKNNRIKVIKRMAYGYRNTNNFRERILLSNRRQACLNAA